MICKITIFVLTIISGIVIGGVIHACIGAYQINRKAKEFRAILRTASEK